LGRAHTRGAAVLGDGLMAISSAKIGGFRWFNGF
jgi:hypothetical protein